MGASDIAFMILLWSWENRRMDTSCSVDNVDAERRFGGLARLYGPEAPERLRQAHVAIAGLGGVGSWVAEALARCGIGALTLIDLDNIAESNVNRQIHALTSTIGQSKVDAMADRIYAINPGCVVTRVEDFVEPDNLDHVLPGPYTVLADCTDQAAAKIAMVRYARQHHIPFLLCGGAGGKTDPLALRAGDLSQAVNDALLAKLRNQLRRLHGFPKASDSQGKALKRVPRMGVRALWFDQPAILPTAWASAAESGDGTDRANQTAAPQGLSCAGYGSVVTVTAVMGMAVANEALQLALRSPQGDIKPTA